MTKKSPTARVMEFVRKQDGWAAAICEKTIPKTWIKKDLFGMWDIVVLTPDRMIGVQATDPTSRSKHRDKLLANPLLLLWLKHADGEIWTFRQPAGKRTYKLTIDDMRECLCTRLQENDTSCGSDTSSSQPES